MAKDLHVVMLPWLAFGHLIPFFELSIALAKAGIKVSFISTPKNIQRLPKIPPNLQSLVKLVDFHLPKVDSLPEGAEATVDITMDKIQYLKTAYDLLQHQFRQFVSTESLDWIIYDFAPYWAAEVARDCKVPQIMFSVFSSVTLAFLGPPEYLIRGEAQKEHWPHWESIVSAPKWITFPSSVAYRPHEAVGIFAGFFHPNASSEPDSDRIGLTLGSCQAVAVRSCREFEENYLEIAEKIYKKPVIPIGLLLPEKKSGKGQGGEIFKWLDQQKHKSVVYVGFGSEVKLSKDQVYEIAHGLDFANLPFFWTLRKPIWAVGDNDNGDGDALPSGFRTRTAKFGMVFMGWAPQLEILAHPSIGGSLFHSGWGSIIETLQHGHTLVVLPLVVDQGLNARHLVEKGLAVEVDRREEDGRFDGSDIAKALKKAMVDQEGERVRVQCNEMRRVFEDQELHYDHYIGGFVEYLRNSSLKQTS